MRNILIFTLLLLTFGEQIVRQRLHNTHIIEDFDHETITTITPISDVDPMLQYNHLMDSLLKVQEKEVLGCRKSDHHDFWQFMFQTVGRVGHSGVNSIQLTTFDDDCYQSMHVAYTYNTVLRRVAVTFTPGPKKTVGQCREFYLIGTTLNYNTITISEEKPHKVYFNLLSDKQLDAFNTLGLYIFRTCDNLENWLGDLLMTLETFFGGFSANPHWGPIFGSHPPPWMVRSNVEFIERAMGHKLQERPNVFVDLQDHEVGNGDFLAVTRLDGLDQIIEWGTGGRIGHSAMIFEIDGEKYVIESQDAWYWPTKKVQKNTWKDWKQYAINAGFMVAVLPLSAESKAKWNQTAAEERWRYMEGQPYGYHNFLFGWIDTPKDNFPLPLSAEFATYLFSFLEKIAPEVITSFAGEALNFRLGTKGLSVSEVAIEAARQGISLGELFARVEEDDWVYSDGPSFACAAFVASMYKAAGLLGDVQGAEFTPKDIYQLGIYDNDYVVPEKCKINDPDLPFCQIMGTHKLVLDGYNTIKPYDHMNEHCPSMPPLYIRPDGC